VSDGVLFRALARGDANLVLRNILLRLWKTPAWQLLLNDLNEVFPGLAISVNFRERTDEFIEVLIKSTKDWVPLEIAGTGVLQTTQILSYIHRFGPSIIVLDEPDSHLHPNNQRLLCALLRRVAEDRGTQVLLTTHSRHIVDAIGPSSGFLWVRNGSVDVAGADDEIGVLLDIGALDVKERAG
jgi:predicted ATPase